MRRLRVLVLMHPDFVPPESTDGHTTREINAWKTEFDVVSTLRAAGHDVRPLGGQEEIKPIRDEIEAFRPPKTYDRDLSRLFSADPRHRREQAASVFIRRHRTQIRQLVARWTGENQLTLDAVLDDMISRCRELNLRAAGSERKLLINFTVLLTAKTMHALFGPSRRKWIAL